MKKWLLEREIFDEKLFIDDHQKQEIEDLVPIIDFKMVLSLPDIIFIEEDTIARNEQSSQTNDDEIDHIIENKIGPEAYSAESKKSTSINIDEPIRI